MSAPSPLPPESGATLQERILALLAQVPPGRVATYGQIAAMAGNPRAARQVARLLHSSSRARRLPWHRIVNRHGQISLPVGGGYEEQRSLIQTEGITFDATDRIDLAAYRWGASARA